jgi:hypothetical protein
MEVAHREIVEAELDRLIKKCSIRAMDPDEREELWQESVRPQHRCYHEPQVRGG